MIGAIKCQRNIEKIYSVWLIKKIKCSFLHKKHHWVRWNKNNNYFKTCDRCIEEVYSFLNLIDSLNMLNEKIEYFQKELNECILNEDYEKCARIKKRIDSLSNKNI